MSRFPETNSPRLAVLRVIAKAGKKGITDEEMGMKLTLSPGVIAECRLDLLEGGFVMDGNVCRKTSLGDDAVVWRLTLTGKQRWDQSGLR